MYRKKQCPQCRKQIGCKRLFRNDYRLSAIISAIIPDIDAYNNFEGETRDQEVLKSYDFNKERSMFQSRIVQQQKKAEAADRKNEDVTIRNKRGRPRGGMKANK